MHHHQRYIKYEVAANRSPVPCQLEYDRIFDVSYRIPSYTCPVNRVLSHRCQLRARTARSVILRHLTPPPLQTCRSHSLVSRIGLGVQRQHVIAPISAVSIHTLPPRQKREPATGSKAVGL